MTSYLGEIVLASDVESAIIDHYKLWQTTYLAEIERLQSRDAESLPVIRSYTTKNELDKFPEEQLPAMVVVSPGIVTDSMEHEGAGFYSALWDVGVAVVASGREESTTNVLRGIYGAVTRAIFLQHPATSVGAIEEWVDESYNDLPVDADRTMAVVQLLFRVRVERVIESNAGLLEPLDDPYAVHELSEVEDIELDVGKISA